MLLKLIFFILLLVIHQSFSISDNDRSYLSMVLKNVNVSVDPCEDFYEYACGNWKTNYASEYYMDMPGYMEHMVNEQFLKVLQVNRNKSGIYEKLWNYYQSCAELTNPALNYYLKLVQPELNFQWPIFRENWNDVWMNETEFDWLSTIAHLRLYGLNGVFLSQNTNVRLTNGSHYILEIHQHQYQARLELKLESIASIFINFGMSEEQSKNISIKIIELEKFMHNLTNTEFVIENEEDDLRYKDSFKEMTIEELIKMIPQIDWLKYLNIILDREINAKMETVQTFALNIKYFEKLIELLNGTSNETISYYIMLKFMYYLNEDLPVIEQKSMFCLKLLRGSMPLAMNFLYEKHYYSTKRSATDAALKKIFHTLKKTFENILEENFLGLDMNERSYILDELNTMRLKIGNIPNNVSRHFVEEYYKDIKMNASDFYSNHLQTIKSNTRRQQEKLKNIPIPSSLQFYEHDSETASSSSPVKIFDNAVLVPYGYLQLPLFDAALSPFLQYSLFGFIIAHEIMHAYDLFHIVYDQHGNYNDMGVSVAHHFWKYVDCFARHPSDNLSENIADVAGLRLVYKAYFDDIANSLHDVDNDLASLSSYSAPNNITNEQLFFINSVQFLCANMEKISTLNTKDLYLEHDMHDVRVRQNWANYENFANAFKCANDTTMNPIVKCRLW